MRASYGGAQTLVVSLSEENAHDPDMKNWLIYRLKETLRV